MFTVHDGFKLQQNDKFDFLIVSFLVLISIHELSFLYVLILEVYFFYSCIVLHAIKNVILFKVYIALLWIQFLNVYYLFSY